MREILFRGKTTKKEQEIHAFHNVWVEGDLIKNREKWHIHPKSNCFRFEKELAKCMIAHEVIPETVGQFTGLTDKNGKKIFESDIVKGLFLHGSAILGVVAFQDGTFGLAWKRGKIDEFSPFPCMCNVDYEIVGNIHDNPELLGE